VENGRNFAVNHPQFAQFRGGDARRAKVGDKHIGTIRLRRLPADGRQDQIA
jgi:hypothetical protein